MVRAGVEPANISTGTHALALGIWTSLPNTYHKCYSVAMYACLQNRLQGKLQECHGTKPTLQESALFRELKTSQYPLLFNYLVILV